MQATGMFDRQVLMSEGLAVPKGTTRALADTKLALWRRQVHAARLAEIGSAAAAVLTIAPSLQDEFLAGSVSVLSDALQQAVWREHFVEFTVPSESCKASDSGSVHSEVRTGSSSSDGHNSEKLDSGKVPEKLAAQRQKFLGYSVLNTTQELGLWPTHESAAQGLNMHGDVANRKVYLLEPSDVVEARKAKLLEDQILQSGSQKPTAEGSLEGSRSTGSHGPMYGWHALHAHDMFPGSASEHPEQPSNPLGKELCDAVKSWAEDNNHDPKILLIFGSKGDLITNDNVGAGPTPSLRLLQHQLYESNSVASGVPSIVLDTARWAELSPQQRIERMHAAVMHLVKPEKTLAGTVHGAHEWATKVRQDPCNHFFNPFSHVWLACI